MNTENNNTPDESTSETGASREVPVVEETVERAPEASGPNPAVVALTAERDRLKDQLLRALADFDNYRKRARRDQDDASRRAREEILREFLPVFDNLERALASSSTATDPKSIADGLQMVLRLFEDTLGRAGGKRLKSVGEPFDPNLHEAIQQVESEQYSAGTVVSEVVPGYQFGDRLLRPAMVTVSKGPAAKSEPDGGETLN